MGLQVFPFSNTFFSYSKPPHEYRRLKQFYDLVSSEPVPAAASALYVIVSLIVGVHLRYRPAMEPSLRSVFHRGVQGLVLLTTAIFNYATQRQYSMTPHNGNIKLCRTWLCTNRLTTCCSFEASSLRNHQSVSMETRTSQLNDSFRLVRFRESVELQTAVYRLTPAKVDSPAEIILVSMVHLADQAYYTEIMRSASSCDRVLFELIVGPGTSRMDDEGRKAVIEYVYPTREQVPLHDILVRRSCTDLKYCTAHYQPCGQYQMMRQSPPGNRLP